MPTNDKEFFNNIVILNFSKKIVSNVKFSYFLFFLKKLWHTFLINILKLVYLSSSVNKLNCLFSRMQIPSFEKRKKLNILLFMFSLLLIIIFLLVTERDFSVIPIILY